MKVGQPPMVRIRGELKPLNRGPIDSEEMVDLLLPMMDERNLLIFERDGGADFAYLMRSGRRPLAIPCQHAQVAWKHWAGRASDQ